MKALRVPVLLLLASALSGCDLIVMNPAGDIARQQADLILYATVLMCIVIVPVLALTVFFAFKYRASNDDAEYDPDWDHSISVEIVVWSVPLAIIICLAGLTWVATHRLNPYNDLSRISEDQPIDPTVKPLEIQVAAMDWKWLFMYPELGIATVNEVAVIVDRPVEFKISSTTVMNAFYVPAMSGMIYAMSGAETELNAVVNEAGVYDGFSANYSGAGFSQMRFDLHAMDQDGFDAWVDKVKASDVALDRDKLAQLNQPSIDHAVTYYGDLDDTLWERIVNICIEDDTLCKHDMMMADALGGGGLDGLWNREMFRGLCTADDPGALMALIRPELRGLEGDILSAISLPPAAQTIHAN